jgi:glucose/mannose-6-phosphate isomerase
MGPADEAPPRTAEGGEGQGPPDHGLAPARVTALDPGDMLGAIAELPRQLTAGYAVASTVLAGALGDGGAGSGLRGVVLCGMGGSAIGADLVLACLPELPVPAAVVRGYRLPAWAGPEALVLAASYSGDTEETLACVTTALERGGRPVCVASGGKLGAVARDGGLPLVLVPGGGQPRAAVGYLSAPLLAALEAAGLAEGVQEQVDEAAALLRAGNEEYAPQRPSEDNPAKALALRLHGHQLVVYGAGLTAPVARRWKGQVNENAKAPAFWNELPELDHNELMGWSSLPQVAASTVAVFLDDPDGDPRLLRRAGLTAVELEARGVGVERVRARGESRLARLFSLVQLGDYVSFYLALLYGVDPTPVQAIQDFKAKLADAG